MSTRALDETAAWRLRLRSGNAAGTEFESGPLTLQAVSTTATLDVTSPTVATRAIYSDLGAVAEAGVATIGVDAGEIVYFGWDWTFETGQEALFADWFEVLGRAVEGSVPQAPGPPPTPAPTPAPTSAPTPVTAGPRFTGNQADFETREFDHPRTR